MKKLIITIVLVLTTLSCQAQRELVASKFNIGYRTAEYSELKWAGFSDCEIKVSVEEGIILIWSKEIQKYTVLTKTVNKEDESTWIAKDINGNLCKVSLLQVEKYDGYIVLAIEYDKLVWFYLIKL